MDKYRRLCVACKLFSRLERLKTKSANEKQSLPKYF